MARDYDARMMMRPGWTNRTSYVIDQNSTIAFSWSEMSPMSMLIRRLPLFGR